MLTCKCQIIYSNLCTNIKIWREETWLLPCVQYTVHCTVCRIRVPNFFICGERNLSLLGLEITVIHFNSWVWILSREQHCWQILKEIFFCFITASTVQLLYRSISCAIVEEFTLYYFYPFNCIKKFRRISIFIAREVNLVFLCTGCWSLLGSDGKGSSSGSLTNPF